MALGITLGDANGVGPEIVLRAFVDRELPSDAVVIGDRSVLEFCARTLGLDVPFVTVGDMPVKLTAGALAVIDMQRLSQHDIAPGKLSAVAGAAALAYLEHAVALALRGKISAIVTLPVNKEAVRLTSPAFVGHTGVVARMCGVTEYAMTLVAPSLVVPHVSDHVSLRRAIETLNAARIESVIAIADDLLTRLGRKRRIAVLGLNPHAGESGAFGTEETDIVEPAIRAARERGTDVRGPLPADTAFMRGLRGEFDAVVCMYHDQGHGPMKTVAMDQTVNVTAGLPIVRTSVDHGTAFDIAYTGTASTGSFVAACRVARQLAGAD